MNDLELAGLIALTFGDPEKAREAYEQGRRAAEGSEDAPETMLDGQPVPVFFAEPSRDS